MRKSVITYSGECDDSHHARPQEQLMRGARDCAPFYENKSQGKIARRSLLSKVPRSPFRLYEGYDVSLLSAL